MLSYAATYIDSQGQEQCAILNDGSSLQLTLRGISFIGESFDDFQPSGTAQARDAGFALTPAGELCDYTLLFDIPLRLEDSRPVTLSCKLELGKCNPLGAIEGETLHLALTLGEQRMKSRSSSGWFEDELVDLERQLNQRLMCCFGCAYSDYHPVGHGLFGGMGCFRTRKQAYLDWRDKAAFMRLWDRTIEIVQETHLCDEYQPRQQGTGYRG